jgi:periplasmic protein TonB
MAAPRLTLPPDGTGEGLSSDDEVVFCGQSQAPLVIHKMLLAELANSVNEAVRAVPRGGAEVGGLLIARSTRLEIVRLRKIFPVPIEYRFGPGFRPSPNDIAAFRRAASLEQADPSNTVVGFYRSATRDPKYLRDTDHQILEALEQVHPSYARDFRFVMILTSVSKSTMLAEVATREEGKWQQWQPHTLNLPLLPDKPMPESSGTATPRDSPASAERPLRSLAGALRAADIEAAINSATVPTPASEKFRSRPALLYLSMALVLLLGVSGVYYGFDARRKAVQPLAPPAPDSARVSRMGFAANPEGGIWKLTWNRDAVTALKPSSASLSIRDGTNQQQIPLTTAELGAGMVFYTPQSGDLVFGLKLMLPAAAPEEEEVRVLQAIRPPQTLAQPSVQIMASDHRIRTVRPFMPPPPAQQQPVRELEPGIPPAITAENKMPATPPIQALVAPLTSLGSPPPTETKPSATSTASYVPPRPVRKTDVKLPVGVVMSNPVEIQIKLEIDATGRVTKAMPLKVNAFNYSVVNPAVHAAESWEFSPALQNGRPVPSEMVVNFQFVSK